MCMALVFCGVEKRSSGPVPRGWGKSTGFMPLHAAKAKREMQRKDSQTIYSPFDAGICIKSERIMQRKDVRARNNPFAAERDFNIQALDNDIVAKNSNTDG